jgi:glycosyltransferase involved in cell wall biosynthesis
MKKKLLFVIDCLVCGGAEKSLVSLLPLIDYDHYDVDLLMFARGGAFEKYVPSKVNVIQHNLFGSTPIDKLTSFLHQLFFWTLLRMHPERHGAENRWRALHNVVKPMKKQYDIAIAYQQGFPTFFVATKVNANKKIAWMNADVFAAGYDMNYCKQFYDKVDRIVPVSQKLLDLLVNKCPWTKDKVSCIYDIVNPELIIELSTESIPEAGLFDEGINIITVGRLSKPKNYLLAVDAARVLKDKGMKFKWFFVGSGGMREAIENRINEHGLGDVVILLGLKENPYPYMAKADIYVQTSSFEGFGLTIAEAKILHKPIVSTNFDVVYDQIVDGKNGLIADMAPESVADRIVEMVNNDSLRASIIRNLEQERNLTSLTEIKKFNYLIEN